LMFVQISDFLINYNVFVNLIII